MINYFLKKETYIKYIPFYITILFAFISSTIIPPHGYAMTFSFIHFNLHIILEFSPR